MSTRRSGLQTALVVSEVALALVLLVRAGLMIQSFERLATAPTGFNPDHVLTVRVPLAKYKYSEGPQSVAFYRAVLERIAAVPGVKSVAMANNLPFSGYHTSVIIPLPGSSPKGPGDTIDLALRSVSPGYFQAMETPLKAGRDFTLADSESNARCVRIINEAMARRYWPGENAVGKQLYGACPKDAPALIVGVVADSKQNSVDSQVEPEVYEPYAQYPSFASFLVTFVIRTSSNPLDLAAAVRNAVWEIDHDQAVIQIRTMENVVMESIWRQHFCASMLGVFAAIALVLSAVGIFGVLSYSVTQRTHEFGIRTALGGTRRDILRLVAGEGLRLILIGVGIGIVAALGLTRLLAGLLYGIRPRDPLTFVTLSVLLTGVTLLAVYIPARRATKLDPMVALSYEYQWQVVSGERAGVPYFPICQLRHAFCTRVSKVAPDAVILKAMRHSSPETKRFYQLGMVEVVRNAMDHGNEKFYGDLESHVFRTLTSGEPKLKEEESLQAVDT